MKRVLLLSLLVIPISVLANGGLPDKPYIYVEGKAEVQKPADVVTLGFELVCRAADQPKANEQLQAGGTKVFSVLKESKINDTEIIAESIRTGPEFEQSPSSSYSYSYSGGRGKLIGYFASRPFEVAVHDVPSFPKVVENCSLSMALNSRQSEGLFRSRKSWKINFGIKLSVTRANELTKR